MKRNYNKIGRLSDIIRKNSSEFIMSSIAQVIYLAQTLVQTKIFTSFFETSVYGEWSLLVSVYASTDLFRNMMVRSVRGKVRDALFAAVPAVTVVLLVICTALMVYNGRSDMLLMRL